jgi:DNA-binding SARP family transcriptional activator/pimeloyl-ACP methyl ester carboxylesterase
VAEGAVPLPITAGKQRALLAILLLSANRVVARDSIVDHLWGDSVPASARKLVSIHVSNLRKALPESRLRTRAPGYELEVHEGELDLSEFERLRSEGREALESGDASRAATLLDRGLSLWRGSALAEFTEPFARPEAARLEELRLGTLELRIEANLELGRYQDVVGELETLIAAHPLRERLRAQQMLALYRSGRQAEALESYRSFRQTLNDELGIEPSSSLKELERRMIRQELEQAPVPTPHLAATPAADAHPTGPDAEIHYARSGDVAIAYQVVGEGPLDLVLVHGWVCSFQPGWENPRLAGFYRRLASMGRLILFDKRGTGLSDRVSSERLPDLETRMDDVRAVLDAAGSDRAVILGVSEGGSMSALFAATHPERTLGLVLMGTFARMMWAPDYPLGLSAEEYMRRLQVIDQDDGADAMTREWLQRVAPDLAQDEAAFRWYRSYLLRGASPAASKAIRAMNREIDIRPVLPTIGVPTLVLYRSDEYLGEATRYMGGQIPAASVVELPGNDHLPWEGDREAVLAAVEGFLSSVQHEIEPDRVLATLLFTDIVGSTKKAAALGDRKWHELLERHYAIVRAQLSRFRGREIDTAGDGMFATFDGPARAVRCAAAIAKAVPALGIEIRAGLHTGEIEQGNGVHGIAVHICARVAAVAGPSEVLVSSTVRDIVAGSNIEFEERGERELAGVPGTWRLFAATGL